MLIIFMVSVTGTIKIGEEQIGYGGKDLLNSR
jgi:hypothetical protein